VLLISLLVIFLSSAFAIDQWALAGHGVSRVLFNGSTSAYTTTLNAKDANTCQYVSYSTPFSWWSSDSGAVLSSNGMLYTTLVCGRDQDQQSFWAINATTGTQTGFVTYSNISSFDSYPVFLPDGTLIVGTSGVEATLIDPQSLDIIGTNTAIVGNEYGYVQVMAVSKMLSTGVQQIIAAGGEGWWWGTACTVKGHTISNCQATKDTTVCLGADGMTAYNDQQDESPTGVVRFNLPLPSKEFAFKTGYTQWPWWIRTDVSGNVYTYDGTDLVMYTKTAQMKWQGAYANLMGVMLTDDESMVIVSNNTDILALSSATGNVTFSLTYSKTFKDVTAQCQSVISPWEQAVPVPLADSKHVIIVCQGKSGASFFASVIDLSTGVASSKVMLTTPPAQAIVDNNGNLYSFGIVNKMPTVQKVPWKTLAAALASTHKKKKTQLFHRFI